jgi:putative restriction endonuclease
MAGQKHTRKRVNGNVLDGEGFLRRIDDVATWKRGGQRAPHKPLLLLLALGRLQSGCREVAFKECRPLLTRLLREFGPSRRTHHPEYPFWRLQADGLWVVSSTGTLPRRASNTDPTAQALLRANAVGAFPREIEALLGHTPGLFVRAAEQLLEKHFADSLHSDIRNAVGLSIEHGDVPSRRRDPAFRRDVLCAYRYACAVCGFSLRLEDTTIGLDAAHIKWRQAYGPDTATNGLALCAIHHKLFDLGAFTLVSATFFL